jgi:ABC-2 type transport system ATP-binding protein
VIVADGLTKRFGSRVAVDGISLSIERGEVFGLIGPDGAGKTTFFRMLSAVLGPTSGTARIAGADIITAPDEVKARIGYMPQAFSLYGDLTVLENLHFVAEVYRVPRESIGGRVDRMLAFSRLAHFKDRLADQLSGGMRQKLALASTLIHQPEVLLLDEPTTGVDPVSRREFWQILYDLNREGMTVLVATPYMDEAERCTRVGLIYQGRLLSSDRPAAIKGRLAGTLLEVDASPRRAALAVARTLPDVLGGTVFGSSLHLVVTDPSASVRVTQDLERRGIAVEAVRVIEPSLEDIFVSLMMEGDRRAS